YTPVFADTPPVQSLRTSLNLNQDWQYIESQVASPDLLPGPTDKQWHSLSLPHSWNSLDATDAVPGYRRDVSWYLKTLDIAVDKSRQSVLYFEGSNLITTVFVNGKQAGHHVGGYVGFRVDIGEYLISDHPNIIAIRVDNSHNIHLIPSHKSDFFIFGGITRDLWLETYPSTHLTEVFIQPTHVEKEKADTEVRLRIHHPKASTYKIHAQLFAPGSDSPILSKEVKWSDKHGEALLSFSFPSLKNPLLWSPASPNLYTVVTQLWEDNVLIDESTQKIGYRWFSFEPYGPFYLNGERLLIRGTHRHEDHAGYGAAMPNELHRKDMEMIKEMGANFVRLAHYPQDPEVYKACDELGLLVWDELPWCRAGVGDSLWQATAISLLHQQIHQNYHHPSIIIWSMGNEVDWEPDFPGGGSPEVINPFLAKINALSHEWDPQRLTAIRKYYDGADLVDVFSPSIWSGWYAGVYTNYGNTLNDQRKEYPQFLHMEYGGSSHVGRHTEHPITGEGILREDQWAEVSNQVNIQNIAKSGDWSENYIVDLFDWYLHVTENQPWFGGNAQWAIKDFATPLRPENAIPYMNQKGLFDRSGNPKDAYYVFKSYWSEVPFAYIESHTWTLRAGPADKEHEFNVFSNAPYLELFRDQVSLGEKHRNIEDFPASGYHWQSTMQQGDNLFIAVGKNAAGEIICTDSLTIHYDTQLPGKPHHISLYAEAQQGGAYLIEAIMEDEAGMRCLDFEDRVYFGHSGTGDLDQSLGTPTGSRSISMANGRAAILFHPSPQGRGTVEVRSQNFKGSFLIFQQGIPAENEKAKAQNSH
ncbi:MAG: beta-galactosidase, partial [Bacteroidia bacterium]|nr:beta-galactosidase [Bacteroidia bacterium]